MSPGCPFLGEFLLSIFSVSIRKVLIEEQLQQHWWSFPRFSSALPSIRSLPGPGPARMTVRVYPDCQSPGFMRPEERPVSRSGGLLRAAGGAGFPSASLWDAEPAS